MLNEDEIAYGQQKNREYIFEECKNNSIEKFGFLNWSYIDLEYEYLCRLANITPW